MASILFYNLIILCSSLLILISLNIKNKSFSIYFKIVAFFIIFIPSASRLNIGTDYINYEIIYNKIKNEENIINLEFLYFTINYIFSKLNLSFECVIIFTSFLFCLPIIKLADKKTSIYFFFFIIIHLYTPSFNIIRQAISLSITCLALHRLFYFNERNKYLFLTIIASLFHISALFSLIIPFLFKIRIQFFLRIVFILSSLALSSFLAKYILTPDILNGTKYAYYLSEQFMSKTKVGSGLGIILQLFPYIMITLFGSYIFKNHVYRNILINISLFIICMKFLILQMQIFSRFEYVLYVFSAMVFTELARVSKSSFFNLILFLIFLSSIILRFESSLLNGENEVIPYVSIFGTI
ncbi:TPA: EpsG family protein [Proteus mirabilis]|uniref:EpsG family protein n=1 Tax=Proteus mirabilis TaxID=584 RepID=UPI001A2B7335|nr:EpsG family protein [Proteus mirabilis]MCT8228458.1 EpsG family protein [Proteus mirabilis]MDF7247340.1 EpsG family protein [Proteus mirabilis]MDF7406871.1 EpsG family protein [Proteus mirabilis]MDF7431552.1 EpsG family protein [Proteus mirabilis]HAT4484165.1 EpsG family protein [Proteus mirabilis]